MRMPKLREMTKEQKDVYLYAPDDAHVLVSGPPGTGKTVIAALRAATLKKQQRPVTVGMFSRVLVNYAASGSGSGSGSGEPEGVLPFQTVSAWFRSWWSSARLPPHPAGGQICIEVPFKDKDLVKAAGARWHKDVWRPWEKKQGVWIMDYETWSIAPECFSAWHLWQSAPCIEGNAGQTDWAAVCDHVMEFEENLCETSLSLGTLLIDEGQDFPPDLYRFLGMLGVIGSCRKSVAYPLRCFVLADENQQLTQYNSTLDEIQKALKISQENRFPPLLDNFRNTLEIAEVARSFFDDVGALPRLPARRGQRPTYVEGISVSNCVEQILTWVINHPGKSVGVLVFKENKREQMQNALSDAASKFRGRTVSVQSYSWDSRQLNRVDDLLFDAPDVISVLNMQSCKGLEFDAVFIVDLHDAQIGLYGPSRFRMQMFVAVSRGREWVQLLETQRHESEVAFHAELPTPDILPRELWQKAATPAQVIGNPVPPVKRSEPTEEWDTWAIGFAKMGGFEYSDKRPSGCFWLYAPQTEAEPIKRGFMYAKGRQGWWRK